MKALLCKTHYFHVADCDL